MCLHRQPKPNQDFHYVPLDVVGLSGSLMVFLLLTWLLLLQDAVVMHGSRFGRPKDWVPTG